MAPQDTLTDAERQAEQALRDKPIVLSERHWLSVPEAGLAYFGYGRAASYAAARRGEIPVIQSGRKLLVPIGQLRRLFGETD
jgi:hypothetical protein